jgi:hypothetical protein
MGVDRTCVLAANPSARRICASVARSCASSGWDSGISILGHFKCDAIRCSRPWRRIILICSGRGNPADNSAVMRFSRIMSSVTGTSYREHVESHDNQFHIRYAEAGKVDGLEMRQAFRSRPISLALVIGGPFAILGGVSHSSRPGYGRSGSNWNPPKYSR